MTIIGDFGAVGRYGGAYPYLSCISIMMSFFNLPSTQLVSVNEHLSLSLSLSLSLLFLTNP